MSDISVQEIEVTKEEAQKMADLGVRLERLKRNEDFNAIIHEYYFKEEASRLVLLKADPTLMGDVLNERVIEEGIKAIGTFRQFMIGLGRMCEQAKSTIEACDEALEEIRNEEE